MTEPKKYWLVDGEGNHALVVGAEERDRLIPLGWTATDEPADGWVHIWREGIEQPGRVPMSALRGPEKPSQIRPACPRIRLSG